MAVGLSFVMDAVEGRVGAAAAVTIMATTAGNIRDLDAEINAINERIKQGIPMTDDELDIYQRKVVRRAKLHDQLTAMTAGD
ncbi:unnamed protein product [Rotaria sp. Silwood1]|nr:unnamed protein product [Rotaria sp. Silwood1]CAF1667106.1 unnamed protein product [Rotaria sp. Silwood1]